MRWVSLRSWVLLVGVVGAAGVLRGEERCKTRGNEAGWEGHNNRSEVPERRTVVQDFGYRSKEDGGKGGGEVGGVVCPDGKPAYYAKVIPLRSFGDRLSASGKLVVRKGAGNTLLGFFRHDSVNEWRTPNSLVFRINGRGDFFHVHVEYATSRWRAGATVIGRHDFAADRVYPLEIPSEGEHTWSLEYDPDGNGGAGAVRAMFDGTSAVCNLSPGHKDDNASFDRFGLLNVVKHADSPGEIRVRDVTINGQREDFAADPKWEGLGNHANYPSDDTRPRFNFGYSATRHAGGSSPGEIGGLFFRGDCRYPDKLAYYGDRLATLTLDRPLRASGRLALLRGVSDSTTLFGFFHSEHSIRSNPSQKSGTPMDFLGAAVEGPSSEGFYAYPVYRVHGEEEGHGARESPPRLYPDGAGHLWSLEYNPDGAQGNGEITFSLGDRTVRIPLAAGAKAVGARFNRFGLVTPWIDGNGQVIYLAELEYTCRQ